MEKTVKQCYESLGLSTEATNEEVRRAYKRLALECDSEKNQYSPEANNKFQELGYAYKRITGDEDLEEIFKDCSELECWLEKQRRAQKEPTFTDKEKQAATKPKNEHKIQKVKKKSKKQLKTEQIRREKEIAKIAEEIAKQQEEQKLKLAKEFQKMKKKKEIVESNNSTCRNGISIDQEMNGNQHYNIAGHKGQLLEEQRPVNNESGKGKTKKRHKKGRARPEFAHTKKEQEPKIHEAAALADISKPSVTISNVRRPGLSIKPVAPLSRSSKFGQQLPNIWMKRIESQKEIREILPTNEEEETRQLEIALEMSKKQVEIDLQQRKLATLQEEINFMSLEREKLQREICDNELPLVCEASSGLPTCEIKAETLSVIENNSKSKEELPKADFQSAYKDLHCFGENNFSDIDSNGTEDGSDGNGCICTHELEGAMFAYFDHKAADNYSRHLQKSRAQTLEYSLANKRSKDLMKPCPYGRNCCLGKNCNYSHLQDKLKEKQDVSGNAGHKDSKVNLNPKDAVSDGKDKNSKSATSQVNLCEVWEDEKDKVCSPSNLPQGTQNKFSPTKSERIKEDPEICAVELKAGECESESYEKRGLLDGVCSVENDFDRMPVYGKKINIPDVICITEDWENEIEEKGALTPVTLTGKSSQSKCATHTADIPIVKTQVSETTLSNDNFPMQCNLSQTGDFLSRRNGDDMNKDNVLEWYGIQSHSKDGCSKQKIGMSSVTQSSDIEEQSENASGPVVSLDTRMEYKYVDPHHKVATSGMHQKMASASQHLPKQFQEPTLVQHEPQYYLPFTNVGIPAVFPGGAVTHQTGLCNIHQMPSMFLPPVNYPLMQTACVPGITPQRGNNMVPENHTSNNPSTPIQESVPVISTDEIQETSCNLASKAPSLTTPTFPSMPNTCVASQGNNPNMFSGVPSNMKSFSNTTLNSLKALPYPVIPVFFPFPLQTVLSKGFMSTPQNIFGNMRQDNLQKSNKLCPEADNYHGNYWHSSLLDPLYESETGSVNNGSKQIQSNPMLALESNYHATLQMQLNRVPTPGLFCAEKHQQSTVNVTEQAIGSKITPHKEETSMDVKNEPGQMKMNKDMLKMNTIRKPSTVPKAVMYAERQ